MKRILLLTAFIAIMMGCKESSVIDSLLGKASDLMEESPDSALFLLNQIEADSFSNSSQQARYALLYTQCQYKNYLDPTSDSLINIAVDYYETNGSKEERFYAYLYQGIVRFLLDDHSSATISLLRSKENSDGVTDHYSKGQMYLHLAHISADHYCFDQDDYAQLAADEYQTGELYDYYINAMAKVLETKISLGEYGECHSIVDTLLQVAYSRQDLSAISEIVSYDVNCDILTGDYDKAKTKIERIISESNYSISRSIAMNYAIVLSHLGNREEALSLLTKDHESIKSRNDTIQYWANASMIYRNIGDKDALIECQDTLLLYLERLYSEEQKNTTYYAQKDYIEQCLLKEREQARQRSIALVSSIILLVLVIMLLLSLNRNKQNRLLMQRERIEHLQLKYDFEKEIRTNAVNALRADSFVLGLHEYIVGNRGIRNDDWDRLEKIICQHLPHFFPSLSSLTHLSESEIHVCMLLKLGFTPREISILMFRTFSAISAIRKRLYKKVFNKEGKPSDWDSFLDTI